MCRKDFENKLQKLTERYEKLDRKLLLLKAKRCKLRDKAKELVTTIIAMRRRENVD